VTDSGDGGESGGDELPCATEGKGGKDYTPTSPAAQAQANSASYPRRDGE